MGHAAELRELLRAERICVAPGAYDVLSAKMACNAGFPAVYVTGFGVTASALGRPDMGFITLDEMVGTVRRLSEVITVPLIVDADAGFGNAVTLARTVREYEAAGAAALHIEDQNVPRRFRPDGLPEVCPAEEHVQKIHAAIEARRDPDFCIIARTDAFQRFGLEEAIRRANLYADAGADIIFVHAAKEREHLRRIAQEVRAPNLVNYSTLREDRIVPLPTFTELAEMGFRLVILPGELLFGAAKVIAAILGTLAEHDGLEGCGSLFLETERLLSEVELPKYRRLEERFLPGEARHE